MLNVIWLILFGILLGIRAPHSHAAAGGTTLLLMTARVIRVLFSDYLGGELVYRFGIGVAGHKSTGTLTGVDKPARTGEN